MECNAVYNEETILKSESTMVSSMRKLCPCQYEVCILWMTVHSCACLHYRACSPWKSTWPDRWENHIRYAYTATVWISAIITESRNFLPTVKTLLTYLQYKCKINSNPVQLRFSSIKDKLILRPHYYTIKFSLFNLPLLPSSPCTQIFKRQSS